MHSITQSGYVSHYIILVPYNTTVRLFIFLTAMKLKPCCIYFVRFMYEFIESASADILFMTSA